MLESLLKPILWLNSRVAETGPIPSALYSAGTVTTLLVEAALIAGGAPVLATAGIAMAVILGLAVASVGLDELLTNGIPTVVARAALAGALGAAGSVLAPPLAAPVPILEGALVAPERPAPASMSAPDAQSAAPSAGDEKGPVETTSAPTSPSRTVGIVGGLAR